MASFSNQAGVKDVGKDLMERFDKIEKFFTDKAEKEVKSPPRMAMGRFTPAGQDPGWLTQDQVESLSKQYDSNTANHLMHLSKGKATRHGSSLHRVLLAGGANYREYLHMNGRLRQEDKGYGFEQLERDTGWVPQAIVDNRSVKNLTGEIHKASAMSENSGILGGYSVPPDFRNQCLTIQEEESTVLPRCMRIPQTTKTSTWPTLDITTNYGTGKSPYEANVYQSWQPEAATINQTNAQLRQFSLTNWDLVTYIVISNDLLQDNSVGLDTILTTLLGSSAAFYTEYAFQNGLGSNSSMPLGALNSPCTIGVDRSNSNTITAADVFTMYEHLQSRSWDSFGWWAHQSTISALAALVSNATTGQFALLDPNGQNGMGPLAGKMPDKLFGGAPLFFTQACQQLGSTGDLRAIDWKHYYAAERMGLQVAVSDQFLFTNNQIVIRAVSRVGGSFWLNNPLTDAQGFTISPSVILDVHS